jgi:hypothetical protein
MAKKDAVEVDPLDGLMESAGIDSKAFREGAAKLGEANLHDTDVFLNGLVYGKERAFFRALVKSLAGGA